MHCNTTGRKKHMFIDGSSMDFSNTSQSQLGIAGWAVGHEGMVNLFETGMFDSNAKVTILGHVYIPY